VKAFRVPAALALILSLVCAGGVALAFRAAWHPAPSFYEYNIPIAVPLAAFILERLQQTRSRGLVVDGAVLVLALLRVFAPPLPFASGHALFSAYAAATAQGWVLRVTAALVVLHVIYVKLFVTGGWTSMVSGLVLAVAAAWLRHRISRSPVAMIPHRDGPADRS
jgi:hypothetical protein